MPASVGQAGLVVAEFTHHPRAKHDSEARLAEVDLSGRVLANCYAGKAPVTRRFGKRELVVANRLACNGHLRDAVQQWAFCSLRGSGWAREFYDVHRTKGQGHHATLRALGNRWPGVLWHRLTHNVAYDEAVHIANRNRYARAA